ncbi:hypothetical protein [Sorangium sp. So ce861]|uniref:hypothetical protein n=1 Tax=Sorangium sp. So ce861 TaxID=3133323 RepID=UPI003F5D9445
MCRNNTNVVVCPACRKAVCVNDNVHDGAPSETSEVIVETCPGVRNPRERALLLGRLPDMATARLAANVRLTCTRQHRTFLADIHVDGDRLGTNDGGSLLDASNLAELYAGFILSPAAKWACCQVVDEWVQRSAIALPDLPDDRAGRLVVVDMTRSTGFDAMLHLCSVRERLNARHAQELVAVRDLSILDFGSCDVFVVNHKNADGNGTTRMVWPIALASDPHEFKDDQIRVLDLSYGDLASIVLGPLLTAVRDGARCAEYMLSILAGTPNRRLEGAVGNVPIRLGQRRCSFLRGARLDSSGVLLCDRWWLTRKSKQPFDLDKAGFRTTASAVLCNLLSILFLAEPRHARVMYEATKIQLELVADGLLSFQDLFSHLGGGIRHGRLLPGANVLGAPLGGTPETKRAAMPMADLKGAYHGALSHSTGPLPPQYEPLMKVLFTVLLHAAFRSLGWTRTHAEPADDLHRLEAREQGERDDDIEQDD